MVEFADELLFLLGVESFSSVSALEYIQFLEFQNLFQEKAT